MNDEWEDESSTKLIFEPFAVNGETGIEIVDPIDRHRYVLRTDSSVAPSPADEGQFPAPVDAAVSIRLSAITLPSIVLTHVRDASGEVLVSTEQAASETVSDGVYTIELHAPIKLYLQVTGPLRVT